MILATMKMKVDPEKRSEFLQIVQRMLGLTQYRTGCSAARLYRDSDDPDSHLLLEEWETRSDLVRHLRSTGFGMLLKAMELLSEPPAIAIRTVNSTDGMKAIEAARKEIRM